MDEKENHGSEQESVEKLKFRYSVRLVLLEKLLLTGIFVLVGFYVNRSLEAYKSSLESSLEAHKSSLQQDLEKYKADQQKQTDSLRSQQEKDIESMRNQQQKEIESLKVVLNLQGALAERRLRAYEDAYAALGEWVAFLLSHRGMVIDDNLAAEIRKKNAETQRKLVLEKLYLDESTSGDLYVILTDEDVLKLLGFPKENKLGGPLYESYESKVEDAMLNMIERLSSKASLGSVRH